MITVLEKIAAGQALLASMQMRILSEQDSPKGLRAVANMTRTLDGISASLRGDLTDLATEANMDLDADLALIANRDRFEDDDG